ncbi:hypothetical protein HK097_001847 [Rhizophlyctis rosea]|uniref:DUF1264-domain-containing protein n=1 Tax=Rhizophlyctis rosea TaxID=64517 RepID=A0AAD5X128_9FUNG|nr:hypothetical protein HK097_001847 [Rhizophlyctis rosea]
MSTPDSAHSTVPVSGGEGEVLGCPTTAHSKIMGAGAAVIQDFHPIKGICRHVHGFHFYAHDMSRQVPAHHYCTHLSEDLLQCLIYDSGEPNARLIGVEYIVSANLYRSACSIRQLFTVDKSKTAPTAFPPEEKQYWHSHEYEVKGGLISLPVSQIIPRAVHVEVEKQEFSKIINTYGKTWHFWQVDRGDKLPFGPPSLMMAFTQPGQINQDLVKARDESDKVDIHDLVQRREELKREEPIDPLADHWKSGEAWQAKMEKVPFKGL